jgi:hypothetical protein
MEYQLQINPNPYFIVVAIPVILTLIGLFGILMPSGYVYADPAHCDQPGWPSCYSVGYTDGQKNPGNSCPSGHSTAFCRGWDDASSTSIRTATSRDLPGSNPACVQLSGDIRNALDQRHFCIGQSDGKNQADADFKNHIELNDNPLTAQDQTKQYSEGYKIGYDDELNILLHG